MNKLMRFGTIGLIVLSGSIVAFGQDQGGAGTGQQPTNSQPTYNGPPPVTGGGNAMSTDMANSPYRIGPGDVLDVRVFNRPQLSREVRVDNDGFIEMPLLDKPLKAACFSETELGKAIATAYLKYQRNPYVSVFIKEYSSQPVAVIGAVNKPGQIILRRRMRLFDAITLAGGPNESAGGEVEIAHTGGSSICDQGTPDTEDAKSGFVAFNLKDTLRGDERANPWLQPGDYVRVPEAEQAYVIGNVYKPAQVSLKEPTTLMRAVSKAGGWSKDSKLSKVSILRTVEGDPKGKLITVDLRAISQQKEEDILLQPNDVVYVPEDGAAVTRTKIINALTGSLTSAFYLIPHP